MSAPSRAQRKRLAYALLALLTVIWGSNWIAMKFALLNADPVTFNVHRTWVAIAVLFTALVWQRRRLWPDDWRAIIITGFFQITVNFGATTMALAGGGVGRTSVLVFTMPFWTLLIAWPVLHERVRGAQWLAVTSAFVGLVLVVQPWNWREDLGPKLWAVLSGFGWAAGTVANKYFQRRRDFDPLQFISWQMLIGVLPLTLIDWLLPLAPTQWSMSQVALLIYVGAISTAAGFLLWLMVLRDLPAGTASLNMFAIPVIALVLSTIVFEERLAPVEWWGIAAIALGLLIISVRALRSGPDEPLKPVPPLEGG